MKKVTTLIIFVSLIIICCNSKNSIEKSGNTSSISVDSTPISSCDEPLIKQIYFNKGCNNEICGYTHYLMVKNYEELCFNDYDFVFVADKYLDTVKKNLPVNAVQFTNRFDFLPEY